MNEHLPPDVRSCVLPTKMTESVVPLRDGTADLVYMINLHHELESPRDIVREAYRLLGTGGKVMIIDWKKEEAPEGPPKSFVLRRLGPIGSQPAARALGAELVMLTIIDVFRLRTKYAGLPRVGSCGTLSPA